MPPVHRCLGMLAMPSKLSTDFAVAFQQLTGLAPFPWQEDLYRRFISDDTSGRIPSVCRIPTGLGKTSLIAVWWIARQHGASLPRRLVYVVNRRTVVDQTTSEVERIWQKMHALDGGEHFAISTLRGQYADNRQWLANPSRPAVICGTVDMIGSRLLFSGYRIGFKSRPLHAGFLGQDALIVHDEAHLEPAFQKLLETIQDEQQKERERNGDLPWPGMHVMALSATARSNAKNVNSEGHQPFELTRKENSPPNVIPEPPTEPIHHVWRRLKAKKTLRLHACDDEKKKLAVDVVERALQYKDSGKAILVFLRTVEDAMSTIGSLESEFPGQVAPLTGTMRGYERDRLVQGNPVFARFMPESDRPKNITLAKGTVYLVCTSAGEVGVNLSADHMVCDLTTFDSMTQRLGRVNRFGDHNDAGVDVVHPNPDSFDEKHPLALARKATLALLKHLHGDASPKALGELPADSCIAAFSPEPSILPATDILFDAWALTTILDKLPGRPPVAPYLHGVAEWEPKRTNVAWRDEVELITDELIEREGGNFPRELLADYPLKPHELLSDRSDRVYGALQTLIAEPSKSLKGEKHQAALDRAQKNTQTHVWLIDESGSVMVTTLGKLLDDDKKRVIAWLEDSTVLLAPSVGGLSEGMLDPMSSDADDVADHWLDENNQPRRQRVWDDAPPPTYEDNGSTKLMALIRTIDLNPLSDEIAEPNQEGELEREVASELESNQISNSRQGRFWHWFARPRDTEDATRASSRPITWDHHTHDVVTRTTEIVQELDLSEDLEQAIILAAELHDLGKQRIIWQRSIGNPNPSDWHAKPGKPTHGARWRPRHLSNYRHEFGSLLDVEEEHAAKLAALSDEMRDVVLHLIASHHGYARPHFPPEAYDHERYDTQQNQHAAHDAMRRYARLQRRYGRWGLAYLESLLRAADWAASAEPSPVPTTHEVKA